MPDFTPFETRRRQAFTGTDYGAKGFESAVPSDLVQSRTQAGDAPEAEAAPDLEAQIAEQQGAREAAEQRVQELAAEVETLQAQLAAIGPALEQVDGLRKAALDRAADDIAAVVIAATRRLVGASLALHPEALPGVIERALAQMPDDDDLRIRVNPRDRDRVTALLDPEHAHRVVADSDIEQGCRVEHRFATIDATLDAAVEGVQSAVDAWLERQPWNDADADTGADAADARNAS